MNKKLADYYKGNDQYTDYRLGVQVTCETDKLILFISIVQCENKLITYIIQNCIVYDCRLGL